MTPKIHKKDNGSGIQTQRTIKGKNTVRKVAHQSVSHSRPNAYDDLRPMSKAWMKDYLYHNNALESSNLMDDGDDEQDEQLNGSYNRESYLLHPRFTTVNKYKC